MRLAKRLRAIFPDSSDAITHFEVERLPARVGSFATKAVVAKSIGDGSGSGARRLLSLRVLSFARDQVTQTAQSREIFRDKLFVFDPDAAITFHERDQSDKTE